MQHTLHREMAKHRRGPKSTKLNKRKRRDWFNRHRRQPLPAPVPLSSSPLCTADACPTMEPVYPVRFFAGFNRHNSVRSQHPPANVRIPTAGPSNNRVGMCPMGAKCQKIGRGMCQCVPAPTSKDEKKAGWAQYDAAAVKRRQAVMSLKRILKRKLRYVTIRPCQVQLCRVKVHSHRAHMLQLCIENRELNVDKIQLRWKPCSCIVTCADDSSCPEWINRTVSVHDTYRYWYSADCKLT